MTKINPDTFKVALIRNLMEAAARDHRRCDGYLLAAAALERGERAPEWTVREFTARSWQDAYGAAGMILPDAEIRSVMARFIKP